MPEQPHPRATGLPRELARRELRVFTTADAAVVYAHPRPQLARLVAAGLLRRLHAGVYAVVPPQHVGDPAWRPPLEAAAGSVGAAWYGPDRAVVVGIAAARLHRAVPRAIGRASVAVTRWRRPISLAGTDLVVRFMQRDTTALDAELMTTALGPILVTTPERTAADLSAGIDGDQADVAEAIASLTATTRRPPAARTS